MTIITVVVSAVTFSENSIANTVAYLAYIYANLYLYCEDAVTILCPRIVEEQIASFLMSTVAIDLIVLVLSNISLIMALSVYLEETRKLCL